MKKKYFTSKSRFKNFKTRFWGKFRLFTFFSFISRAFKFFFYRIRPFQKINKDSVSFQNFKNIFKLSFVYKKKKNPDSANLTKFVNKPILSHYLWLETRNKQRTASLLNNNSSCKKRRFKYGAHSSFFVLYTILHIK